MAEKIYPKGIRVFKPHEKAPDFINGNMVITLNELVKFCKDNPELLTDYNGEKQLKLQLLDGSKGLSVTVDTYKRNATSVNSEKDDLPF